MDLDKRERLESKGWKVGSVSDFLELTPEESVLVEIKLALSQSLKERRQNLMTQSELASKMSSSQPRIAKAENGDASVSIELLIRAMLATGATPQDIGQVIAGVGQAIANMSSYFCKVWQRIWINRMSNNFGFGGKKSSSKNEPNSSRKNRHIDNHTCYHKDDYLIVDLPPGTRVKKQ